MFSALLVKIVASLGPSSGERPVVLEMAKAGASGFRVNFAHGEPGQWRGFVEAVRWAEERVGRPLALIGDLQGASVRVGVLEKPLVLKRGSTVRFVLAEKSGGEFVPVPQPRFFEVIDVGDLLVMDDGRVRLRVVDVRGDSVEAVALTDGVVSSRKAVAVQGKEPPLPPLTEKDLRDLRFAVGAGFDYVALSYVRSGEDVELLRSTLRRMGAAGVGVVSKIETRSAIRNLDDIVDASDVVVVARGDLGMNFSLEEVHRYQRMIVRKCLEKGKPVVVATQLLESMVESPVPTRAEVVDVSVAVEEGVDALMLTGETSIGKYPVEAVVWLRRIIEYTERNVLPEVFDGVAGAARGPGRRGHAERFARGVLELAEDIGARLVVYGEGGDAALFSSLRPRSPVYAAVGGAGAARKLAILWGLVPYTTRAQSLEEVLGEAVERELVDYGERVVLVKGAYEGVPEVRLVRVDLPQLSQGSGGG